MIYSQTSRKLPPKMQTFSGHLRGGGGGGRLGELNYMILFREGVPRHLKFDKNIITCSF